MVKAEPMLVIRQIDTEALKARADAILRKAAQRVIEEVEDALVGADWSEIPRFKVYGPRWTGKSRRGRAREVLVVPWPGEEMSQIFSWVDQGTEGPYTIRAKNAPFLVFSVPHAPKTLPLPRMVGGLPSLRKRLPKGEVTGEKHLVAVKEVTHPGIEPRLFMKYSAARMRQVFAKEIAQLFKQLPVIYDPAVKRWRSVATGRFAPRPL